VATDEERDQVLQQMDAKLRDMATTESSNTQPLEPDVLNRHALARLKALEVDLRKYANKAEQALFPVLEGSDERSSLEFWAGLSGREWCTQRVC
jgi:predicted metalloendopeptidase